MKLSDGHFMVIKPFYEPGTGTWTYLLSDPARGAAAVIDPVGTEFAIWSEVSE